MAKHAKYRDATRATARCFRRRFMLLDCWHIDTAAIVTPDGARRGTSSFGTSSFGTRSGSGSQGPIEAAMCQRHRPLTRLRWPLTIGASKSIWPSDVFDWFMPQLERARTEPMAIRTTMVQAHTV